MQERTIRFLGGGTTLDCARLIKDLLVCAFDQRGGVLLPATFQETSPGVVKITIYSPNGRRIENGLLTICVSPPVCGPLHIAFSREGRSLSVNWPGTGTLQVAPDVTGPWEFVAEATNPYITTASMPRCFFRLVCP